MVNAIAVIWDCDKTLIDGYMQSEMFKDLGINEQEFWKETNALPEKIMETQRVKVNKDTVYLNQFINKIKNGEFNCNEPIDNNWLKKYGKTLRYYPGIPEFLLTLKQMLEKDENSATYKEFNIVVENYIVSTGFKAVIEGSELNEDDKVKGIWGCELIEGEVNGKQQISEIGYTIDNTTKTRALFEVNKGVNIDPNIDVNAKVPEELRRIPFERMIYIADGPSDVPAFSVVNKGGGYTFAVYPKGDLKAFEQVERLRADGRIQMYAEANYTEGSTAYMVITHFVKSMADSIVESERQRRYSIISDAPGHLPIKK